MQKIQKWWKNDVKGQIQFLTHFHKVLVANMVARIGAVPAREVERTYDQYKVVRWAFGLTGVENKKGSIDKLVFRAVAKTVDQQKVLDRAVRATEEEETGCEFLKEAHK